MTKLFILGTANAIPGMDRENTYFLLENADQSVLIDCGINAFPRLMHAGISHHNISDIILTHFHPDHVTGLPLTLMDWWLLGRKTPLCIHGLPHTLERTQAMMDLFDWQLWPGFFPVTFHPLHDSLVTVLDNESIKIQSMAVKHLIPTIGLRMEMKKTKKVIAYSCDTEPCQAVIQLGADVDILIHEAAGDAKGHSSARQCGTDAAQANAKTLMLIHYPADIAEETLILDARETFGGQVLLATDGMVIE
jgi:ribonuclease Z